ncbi:MAG: 3-oxoacyl-(acyl-carrier-protein) synthase 2 [Pelosinus sp.]|nr:3-oxoacyl-(acyl-carrier-protein) synthase 2 [Pelosinus sp.]
MKRRVVITGMGAVSSLGCGADNLWQSIKQGKSGISRIERINVADLPTQVGAEIKDFDPNQFLEKKKSKGWIASHNMLWQLLTWPWKRQRLILIKWTKHV